MSHNSIDRNAWSKRKRTVIYAPNRDLPGFLQDKISHAHDMSSDIGVIGDFNTVLNPHSTRKNTQSASKNQNASNKIKQLMEAYMLNEISKW